MRCYGHENCLKKQVYTELSPAGNTYQTTDGKQLPKNYYKKTGTFFCSPECKTANDPYREALAKRPKTIAQIQATLKTWAKEQSSQNKQNAEDNNRRELAKFGLT